MRPYLVIDSFDFIDLKGQYISTQGSAMGNGSTVKTVRHVKMIKAKKLFRTEMFIEKYKETRVCTFRPKLQMSIEQPFCADDFHITNSTLGVAQGYYNYPFQGKEKLERYQWHKFDDFEII